MKGYCDASALSSDVRYYAVVGGEADIRCAGAERAGVTRVRSWARLLVVLVVFLVFVVLILVVFDFQALERGQRQRLAE